MSRLTLCLGLLTACGGGGGFPDAPPIDQAPPLGTYSLTWSVVDQNSQPISCDRIGASTMTVLAHDLATEGGVPEALACSSGTGTSQAVKPGTYEMNFELTGPGGLLATAPEQMPVQIQPGQNTVLAPVTFQVDARGNLNLQVSAGKTGGNCGSIGSGGAGITGMTITLTHNSDQTCEPLTLNISAGASGTAGTYTINCTTPTVRACIESDQVLTATNVPSDSYAIRVRGMVGANACYLNSDSIVVPALNKVLQSTLNLAQQTQTPGC